MKNAMKKIMSLVLVAMILVSAVPFAASAAGYDVCVDGTPVGVYETITYEQALALSGIDTSAYDVNPVYNIHAGAQDNPFAPGQTLDLNAIGNIVYIWFQPTEKVAATPDPEPVAPTAYPMSIDVDGEMKALTDKVSVTYEEVLQMVGLKASDVDYIVYEGDVVEGTRFLDAGDTIKLAGATRIFVFTEPKATEPEAPKPENKPSTDVKDEGYYKFSGDVQLWIYLNGSKKIVTIKDGIAADGKVTMNEVKSVVKYYYNAIDGDTGIICDGIYPQMGNWVLPYAKDDKVEVVEGLYDAANNNDVVALKVVISNAKLASSSSSSNADSSNPKTGDEIYMAITAMAVSASALALGFYFNKKRAI